MILDQNLVFSDSQNLAQAAGSYLSDKSVNLGPVGSPVVGGPLASDLGKGNVPELLVQVVTAFTTSASGTLQVQLVMADDAPLTTNLTVLCETTTLAVAALVAGYQFRLQLPPGISQQYLGLKYIIGTGAMTAGKVTAGLILQRQETYVG